MGYRKTPYPLNAIGLQFFTPTCHPHHLFIFFIIVKRRKCHCLLLPQFTFTAAKSSHATQQLACCHTAASCSSPKHADATTQLLPQLALPSRHLSPCFMAVSTEPPVLASSELSLALGSPQVGKPSPPPPPRTNPVQFPGPTCSSSELSLKSVHHCLLLLLKQTLFNFPDRLALI
jgi:hypothetical protein